mgnify:CR=1 FL=1
MTNLNNLQHGDRVSFTKRPSDDVWTVVISPDDREDGRVGIIESVNVYCASNLNAWIVDVDRLNIPTETQLYRLKQFGC